MTDLTVLTISNRTPDDPKLIYQQFLASCRRYGFEPVVVGGDPGEFAGLGSRPRIIQRAIEKGLAPTKYMLFSDAWDVVLAENPERILEWFLSAQRNQSEPVPKIIWNAERNCFPDGWQAERHPEAASGFRYLNSGFAIGETSAYLEALKEMHAEFICNDYRNHEGRMVEPCCQAFWMREFLFGPVPMALDSQCEMALTMHGMELSELDFSGSRIQHVPTGSFPMAFHGNGDARNRDALSRVLSHLKL